MYSISLGTRVSVNVLPKDEVLLGFKINKAYVFKSEEQEEPDQHHLLVIGLLFFQIGVLV
jgi:hypothetical protein